MNANTSIFIVTVYQMNDYRDLEKYISEKYTIRKEITIHKEDKGMEEPLESTKIMVTVEMSVESIATTRAQKLKSPQYPRRLEWDQKYPLCYHRNWNTWIKCYRNS